MESKNILAWTRSLLKLYFSCSFCIRMSHWCHTLVDGVEFWISCRWLAFLNSFSCSQVIQNTNYFWSSAVCNYLTFKFDFSCLKLYESFYFFFIEEYHSRSTFFYWHWTLLVAMFDKKYRRNNKKSVRNLVLGDCLDSKTQIIRRHNFQLKRSITIRGWNDFWRKKYSFFLATPALYDRKFISEKISSHCLMLSACY